MADIVDLEVGRHALRSFFIKDDHLWPIALSEDDCWPDGTCVADCKKDEFDCGGSWGISVAKALNLAGCAVTPTPKKHSTPTLDCECGIYGTLSLEHLVGQYPEYTKELVCVIAVEGDTILGSKGLRTAAARVVAYGRKIRRSERLRTTSSRVLSVTRS